MLFPSSPEHPGPLEAQRESCASQIGAPRPHQHLDAGAQRDPGINGAPTAAETFQSNVRCGSWSSFKVSHAGLPGNNLHYPDPRRWQHGEPKVTMQHHRNLDRTGQRNGRHPPCRLLCRCPGSGYRSFLSARTRSDLRAWTDSFSTSNESLDSESAPASSMSPPVSRYQR